MIYYAGTKLKNEILKSVILTILKNFRKPLLLSVTNYTRTPSFNKFAEKLEEIEFSEFYLPIGKYRLGHNLIFKVWAFCVGGVDSGSAGGLMRSDM